MTGLLVGQRVYDGLAELGEFRRGDRVEVDGRQGVMDRLGAAADHELDAPPDMLIDDEESATGRMLKVQGYQAHQARG